jgi:phosphoserine phosphatase
MSRCAAFFDVDGTITREGLISELFRKMVKYELIDETKWQLKLSRLFPSGTGAWGIMTIICRRW